MGWDTKCDLSSENAQFLYCAQGPPALAFSVLFGVSMIAHLTQAILHRKRYCWVICMAVFWETAGFVLRTYATKDQTQQSTQSASQLLILLAPLWVNAFVYMTFGRMVWYYLPEKKIRGIQAEKMAKIFVWLDVTAFLVQATGGLMDVGTDANLDRIALNIYTAGIALQEFFIICFLYLAISFHRKMGRGEGLVERGRQWKTLTYVMYTTLFLISVRIIYRLAEYANGGATGPTVLSTNETFFYIFEATPMCAAIALWNLCHPGRILTGPESLFPKKIKMSRKEKKQIKREKKEEKKAEKARKKNKKRGLADDDLPVHMDEMNTARPMPAMSRSERRMYDEESGFRR